MWIRTQDKLGLVNANKIKHLFIEDISIMKEKHDYLISAYKDVEVIVLGIYSSKENAIKALNYIQNCIYLEKREMNMLVEKDGELLR
jgi:low affinity Fe/Cu permease